MTNKQRFTLKQFLPFLSDEERKLLGSKIARYYRITHKRNPTKVEEDGLTVCAYTLKFFKRASDKITII